MLAKLLDGIETLAPGSKQHFCQMMSDSEKQSPVSLKQSLIEIIEVADEDELLDAMGAIANRFRYLRNFSEVSAAQSLINVNECA
ncbi:hypothetical protein A6770_37950 [Nostoc minutum NIES-26]|uniref:Uncharacterized protein n=1 Tax=Nostoc minutum NIES-26 TaxID=1844469 RepID=A0A367RXX0_9NOSO|nr:hypothetical protein A6770_37950 [Nostoc minutum NIES-26]